MKYIFLFSLLLFFNPFTADSQRVFINGKEGLRKLKWTDFTGPIDKSSNFIAVTTYNYKMRFNSTRLIGDSVQLLDISVDLYLDPQKTWVKFDKITDNLLAHEQGHFNLGILLQSELLEILTNTRFHRNSYQQDVQTINNEINEKYKQLSLKYDASTEHSKNTNMQAKWNDFFAQLIEFPE
jgi:hypothetical protein